MFLTVKKVLPPYLEDVTKGLTHCDWKNTQIQKADLEGLGLRPGEQGEMSNKHTHVGFTLLEVMVAMAIIAIALTAVLGSQSQSVSLASEAKFYTTAPLLAQSKLAELEAVEPEDLSDGSGDFGDDFPGYSWEMSLGDVFFERPENVSDRLRQIDLKISWGQDERFQYRIRLYRFVPRYE